MKILTPALLFAALLAPQAHASLNVYDCQLEGGKGTASLTVYADQGKVKRADWMPDAGLKTTKANLDTPDVKEGGITQFTLFGFQDQADMLILPAGAGALPKTMKMYTYHDDDDEAVDVQNFDCVGH